MQTVSSCLNYHSLLDDWDAAELPTVAELLGLTVAEMLDHPTVAELLDSTVAELAGPTVADVR